MTAPSPESAAPPPRYGLWIGIAVGVFLLGVTGIGGIMALVYRGTEGIAKVGSEYLQKAPEIQKAVGSPPVVQRRWLPWRVNVRNDSGSAMFTYDVRGPSASGIATVALSKHGGNWTVLSASFRNPSNPGQSIRLPKND